MNLQIGVVVNHKNLGLMILTEKYENNSRLHGQSLFKMEKLFDFDGNKWILYEEYLYKITEVTDNDYIKAISSHLCSFNLSQFQFLEVRPDRKCLYISTTAGDFVMLDRSEIKKLKKILNELE